MATAGRCHSSGIRRAALLPRWLAFCAGLAMLPQALPSIAAEYVQRITQMAHTVWRTQDGDFSTPNKVVRTRDGYLWIGTANGLVRFDGARFVRWNEFGPVSIAGWNIETMLATEDGSLWIGAFQHVARIRGREFLEYDVPGRPLAMVADDAGTVWIAQTRSGQDGGAVCSLRDGQVRCFGAPELPLPWAHTLASIPGGGFWVGGSEALCRWIPGHTADCHFEAQLKRTNGLIGVSAVQPTRDGALWVGFGNHGPEFGLRRMVDGQSQPLRLPGHDTSNFVVLAILEDRAGGLWVGTETAGLYRIRGENVEHFGMLHGLSSNSVVDLYEDEEGSIWVVTTNGLHQFRSLPISRFSATEGLPRDGDNPVLAMSDGNVWIEKYQLRGLEEGRVHVMPEPTAFRDRIPTALMEDHLGRLWIGLDRTLNVYENDKLLPVRRDADTDLGVVVHLVEDANHDVWALTFGRQRILYRIRGLAVLESIDVEKFGLPKELAADPQSGIWLGYINGDLARYRDGSLTVFPADDASRAAINHLAVDADGTVLASTTAGVLVQRAGIRQRLGIHGGLPCEDVKALVRDRNNALWLNADCGFIKIGAAEFERWLSRPGELVEFALLDATSGAQSGASTFSPRAQRGSDGRVWFATRTSAFMVDIEKAQRKAVPPPVVIEEIRADRAVFPAAADLVLPAEIRDLEIRYTALSLVAPGKIRFQYLLEGRDTAWHDADTRRQAFYTDLPPGRYRFRVKASNSEGVWNEAGAAIDLELPAMYYQSRWFIALCAIVAAGALYGLYLRRLGNMKTQLRERLAAKTSERERIARDLHDTLLQSTQGLILSVHAVALTFPADDPKKNDLQRVLASADRVLAEGRDRVLELRLVSDNLSDLPQALARVGEELAKRDSLAFHTFTEGTARRLQENVREEVYRIGREALFNAFHHAHARSIEVHLVFNDDEFLMRVRDDGVGIDSTTLKAGSRSDHWGLPGMRERTTQLGATLQISSGPGEGTEIEVKVPAFTAYGPDEPSGRRWLKRITSLFAKRLPFAHSAKRALVSERHRRS